MTLERFWYEASPYLYAVVGIATAVNAVNLLMKASGLVLLTAAFTILGLRWIYRHDVKRGAPRLNDERYLQLITQDLFYDKLSDGARRSNTSRSR